MKHAVEFIGGPVDGGVSILKFVFETYVFRRGDIEHVYAIRREDGDRGPPVVKNGRLHYRHVPELTGLIQS